MPTQLPPGGAIAVSRPFTPVPKEHKPLTVRGVPPLLDAIMEKPSSESPHRIMSYETENGQQFNCAYFDDEAAFLAYDSWFEREAVSPAGAQHKIWASRFNDAADVPASGEWMWGVGKRVIADSRSGEYQLGDGHRYSRMMFRDEAARKDAEQAAVDPQFEARIFKEMAEEGVEYYGRLVMAAPGAAGGWFTKSRYGSLEDVHKGTWLIKEILFKEEMARWFSSYETIMGSIVSTHLVTPKWPDGSEYER